MQILKEPRPPSLLPFWVKGGILAGWMSGEFSNMLIRCFPSVWKMNFGVCRLRSVENFLNVAPSKRTFSYMSTAVSFRSELGMQDFVCFSFSRVMNSGFGLFLFVLFRC